MVQETRSVEAGKYAEVSYVIDPGMAEAQGRDLGSLLLDRRCHSCRERIEGEESIPTVEQQMKEIARCCSSSEGFIRPGMPMMEIAFRLLLKTGNKVVTLKDLHWDISEEWARPTHPMNISMETLKNILDRDRHYGFREVTEEMVEEGKKKGRRRKKS